MFVFFGNNETVPTLTRTDFLIWQREQDLSIPDTRVYVQNYRQIVHNVRFRERRIYRHRSSWSLVGVQIKTDFFMKYTLQHVSKLQLGQNNTQITA